MMEHIGYFFRKLGKEKEFYSMLKNKAKHPSEIRRYVIDTILKNTPPGSKIVDMGCGYNWIKQLESGKRHNVVGVDPSCNCGKIPDGISSIPSLQQQLSQRFTANLVPDVIGKLGDEWCNSHANEFDVGFALNSLHFTYFTQVHNNILKMMNLISEGGYCYISLNVKRMMDVPCDTTEKYFKKFLSLYKQTEYFINSTKIIKLLDDARSILDENDNFVKNELNITNKKDLIPNFLDYLIQHIDKKINVVESFQFTSEGDDAWWCGHIQLILQNPALPSN